MRCIGKKIAAGLLTLALLIVLVRFLIPQSPVKLNFVSYSDHGATAILRVTNRTSAAIHVSKLQVMVATPGGWEYFPAYRKQIPGWGGHTLGPGCSRRLEALFPWPQARARVFVEHARPPSALRQRIDRVLGGRISFGNTNIIASIDLPPR